jgi:hypothetical protein
MASNFKEFAPIIDLDDVYQAKDIIAIAKRGCPDAEDVHEAVMLF